ncbi:MAG: YkgJ family cysteine cluster protein [Campylobacterota bacterium]|nr:YkgJ family cysteine cluster protein [Campylobacterota bacterium]
MSNLVTKDGYSYSFNPQECSTCSGKCCTGESGNIFLNSEEIEKIALHVELPTQDFIFKYLKKVGFKYSIKEQIVGISYDCIFYNREQNGCAIYDVRPTQCTTFPFWDYYKHRVDELKRECPGVIGV